jgi:group II intron reverse transcriptase/maturase
MRDAETVLAIIRERGRRGLPLERVYRLLFNQDLYLRAYGKIGRNRGALTRGVTAETVDGMSLAKIEAIIDAVRRESYRWTPGRRTYIEKKGSTKKRPLGIPTWSDKLLQEVVRSILEAYYEPQFSPRSHGFRPNKGCHTALTFVRRWTGTKWFIEGDISQCFDRLDHQVLLSILREKIHDNRFLRLIEGLLKAGYLEEWRFNATLSGTPQGGVVSPLLANIYLDRLDKFVEAELLPRYNQKKERRTNSAYLALNWQRIKARRTGDRRATLQAFRRMQTVPYLDPHDPDYRRLRYVRYADDFLLGFAGPKAEAAEIKRRIGEFLRETLKLDLSEAKTLITHAHTERARFLGYEIKVMRSNTKLDSRHQRSVNGGIHLGVPRDVVTEKCRQYTLRGKPHARPERSVDTDFSIIAQFQNEYRGLVEYYRLANNLAARLKRYAWVMQGSLVRTLAMKFKVSSRAIYRRYSQTMHTDDGPRKVLRVVVTRDGKPPLAATWGITSLKRRPFAVLNDQPHKVYSHGTELVERLLADTCELCGSTECVQVHHVRILRRYQPGRETGLPDWAKRMAARQRKTLVVCRECHESIHTQRPYRTRRSRKAG